MNHIDTTKRSSKFDGEHHLTSSSLLKISLDVLFKKSTYSLLNKSLDPGDTHTILISNEDSFLKYQKELTDYSSKKQIVCRCLFSRTPSFNSLINKLNNITPPGSTIFFQELNIEEITYSPFNYALGRTLQIIKELNKIRKYIPNVGNTLPQLITSSGLKIRKSSFLPPYFLNQKERNSIVTIFGNELLEAESIHLINNNERTAILAEIKAHLRQTSHLISLPRTIQIEAFK